jgi:hypothetical protein
MARITQQEIRNARIVNGAEKFNETARRLGCCASEVHRAVAYEALTAAEKEAIMYNFLSDDLISEIANKRGTTQTAVLKTIKGALVHARVEAALATRETRATSHAARWAEVTV